MKHLLITCLSYMLLGFWLAAFTLGDRSKVSLEWGSAIYFLSVVIFFYVAVTSLQEIKDIINKHKP